MMVIKRNGSREPVSFDKISVRIQALAGGLEHIDPLLVAQKVVQGVYDGVHTSELDNLAGETAAYMSTIHPNYEILAGRIVISNLHKETNSDFFHVVKLLHEYVNPQTGRHCPLIANDVFEIVKANASTICNEIVYERDFDYGYFSAKTLFRGYLLMIEKKIVERPQHMLMRVSIGIHKNDLESAFKTYHLMSKKYFTHASPTMFNAGTPHPQCSSCFLLSMTEDSIEGIYETLTRCAKISKAAGGIGVNLSCIRASGSYISGTNGNSNGLTPMLRVYNATARYVDQGGGKRKGAFAIYLEPWHADIFEVLELKKNTGPDELRARDLFYALWIPDLFMKRVEANSTWSLMCPHECPGLFECYGDEFEQLYIGYEAAGRARKTIQAQDLWFAIIASQIESGTPYMLYKDSANRKSNQRNLGTIRGSNLCCEIIEYTDKDEVAVCNLASIALNMFVTKDGVFDHNSLYDVVCQVTRNLNRVIDINYYPIEEARRSNMRHRPIGIGVQGLQDVFFLMKLPFESKLAAQLNQEIFETIYFAAVNTSCKLAKEEGTYETYLGSPASQGQLQFDLWDTSPYQKARRWNWTDLKLRIKKHGLRNSLLVSPMPTASTAQILGNVECFEPLSSNIYSRTTLAGSFTVINHYLVKDLQALGLWTPEMKNSIISAGGSIQAVPSIPQELKDIYKTVWEVKQRTIIDMAADRGVYIDQSQSMNIHMAEPTFAKMSSLHFYAWKKGLKTGLYYLRSRPAANAVQFTVDKLDATPVVGEVCTMEDGCLSCGS